MVMAMNFHRSCEAIQAATVDHYEKTIAILKAAIEHGRSHSANSELLVLTRAETIETALRARIQDLEEHLVNAHEMVLLQANNFAERERSLTDRLLAFANPAGYAAATRLQTPAPTPTARPRPTAVGAVPGSRAPLTPAGAGFNPSPEQRQVQALERGRQALEKRRLEELAATQTQPDLAATIEDHIAADAAAADADSADAVSTGRE